jgi:putative transposase
MVSAQARREQVDYAVSRGRSVRRSCALLTVSRSALGYQSKMPDRDGELGLELEQIAKAHPRYGHRFAWALLRQRERWRCVNRKRVRRVWRALGLMASRRWKRRKIRTGVPRTLAPTGPNQVWAYDFVHDRCGNGQQFKALTIVDEWTRECLAIEVATSITAERVITVLRRLFESYGTPSTLRSDNGPEFIARALKIWALMQHSELATIEPGKPWQNGSVESFNGTFRGECLDREWFAHLREARIVIEQWRWEYNTKRPHSSLGYRTPSEVGTEARSTMTQESRTIEIVAVRASNEADFSGAPSEVHPITTENLS